MTDQSVHPHRPGPWDRPPVITPQAAPQPTPSPLKDLAWGIISTALLAGWLAWTMGWVWALAGVVGVFVHEYGHVLAMNALGCGPGRIRIIPFLGGSATPARAPSTEFKGVLIALAGPCFGLLAALPFFAAHAITGQALWLEGALFIGGLNLINLAPAPPLDGSKALGPALARIHPMVERGAMLAVGLAVALWAISRGSYIFGVFVALAMLGSFQSKRLRPLAERLTGRQQAASVALFAAVAVDQLGPLAAQGLGGQGRGVQPHVDGGGMKLHEFRIADHRAGQRGQRQAFAPRDRRIGRHGIQPADAAGGQDHRRRLDLDQLPASLGQHAAHPPVGVAQQGAGAHALADLDVGRGQGGGGHRGHHRAAGLVALHPRDAGPRMGRLQ